MTDFSWWQVAVVGPLVGFVGMLGGGYWGVGCGWIVVPIMLILGFDPLTAVGTGSLQMVPSTILTVAKQAPEIGWKRGEVGRVLALPVMAGALLTSLAGRFINEALKNRFGAAPLQWMTIVFISFIAFQTLCSRTACYNDAMPELPPRKSLIGFVSGMVTGLISSLLGVGGGIVIRPLLTSGFKVPEFYTSRIVRLMVLVTTTCGGAMYLCRPADNHLVILLVAACVAVGGVIGFPLGAKMHHIVYDAGYAQHIHKSFASIAVIIPVATLLKIYGQMRASQILSGAAAVILFVYLCTFTWYAKTHPKAQVGASGK